VNIADKGLSFYRTAVFIVKLEIQVEDTAGMQSVQTDNTILQSPCGYVGDLCEALALIVLVECCICSGQVYSLTVMAPVIEQNPKNSFAAASDF